MTESTKKTSTETAHKQVLDAAADQKAAAAKTVGVDLNAGAVAKARKEGALDAEKEQGKAAYKQATDGNLPGEPSTARQFPGHLEIMQYEGMLGLGLDEFTAAIAEDAPNPIPEEKVYGLLGLERNGQNRTEYVKAAIKRLGLTKDDPLPGGGPGYTNDVHAVSDLYS